MSVVRAAETTTLPVFQPDTGWYVTLGVCYHPDARSSTMAFLIFGPCATIEVARACLECIQAQVRDAPVVSMPVCRLLHARDGRPSRAQRKVKTLSLMREGHGSSTHAIGELSAEGIQEYLTTHRARLIPATQEEMTRLPYHVLMRASDWTGPRRVV